MCYSERLKIRTSISNHFGASFLFLFQSAKATKDRLFEGITRVDGI